MKAVVSMPEEPPVRESHLQVLVGMIDHEYDILPLQAGHKQQVT